MVGAAGLVLDDEIVVFQGGVDYAIFKAAVDNALLQRKAAGLGLQEVAERLKQEQSMYMKHEPDWDSTAVCCCSDRKPENGPV